MKKESKIVGLVVVASILIIYAGISSYMYEEKLKKNGKITIAKLDSIQEYPKRTYGCISFYVGNTKHTSLESGLRSKISKKDIGKFYYVKYLPNATNIVRGVYSKEITDTIAILKAGFSKEDIEK
jgi:hypothetical protein